MFSVCLSVFVFSASAATPTKNYIKYDNLQVSSQILNSSGSPHNDYEIFPLQQVDIWYNYFYKLTAWPYNESYIIRVSIKDFFKGLSSDNTYHYHLTFGFIGGSTVYSKLGTTGTALVNSSSFTTSKSSVSNGDTRYVFDFGISGMSGNSDLVLSFPVSASTYGELTFLCSSYGDASYYTVLTGVDKQMANDDENTEKIGGWISQAVSNLISGIMDILMDVFCPSLEYIQGFINDIDDFLVEHLGFLYYPFHVIVEILNSILEFNPTSTPSITLPSLVVPVGEERYTLWEDTAYTFDIINTEPFKTVHQLYLAAVDCSLAFGLIMLFRKKLDEVMTR